MSDEKQVHKKLKKAFEDIDQNADGKLSKDELEEYLSYKNMTPEQIEEFITKLDIDKNGEVDYKEFQYYYIESMIDGSFNKSLKEAFDNADKNKDGLIDADEVDHLMKYFFGRSNRKSFMDDVDVDKDGKVNYKGNF